MGAFLKECLVSLGAMFLLCMILVLTVVELSLLWTCSNYEKITGTETKVAHFDSCYIDTNNGWQRWDEYKSRSVAKDSLK